MQADLASLGYVLLEMLAGRSPFEGLTSRAELLQAKNTLRLKWGGRSCTLEVELPPGDKDEIARLGPYVCRGVTR